MRYSYESRISWFSIRVNHSHPQYFTNAITIHPYAPIGDHGGQRQTSETLVLVKARPLDPSTPYPRIIQASPHSYYVTDGQGCWRRNRRHLLGPLPCPSVSSHRPHPWWRLRSRSWWACWCRWRWTCYSWSRIWACDCRIRRWTCYGGSRWWTCYCRSQWRASFCRYRSGRPEAIIIKKKNAGTLRCFRNKTDLIIIKRRRRKRVPGQTTNDDYLPLPTKGRYRIS